MTRGSLAKKKESSWKTEIATYFRHEEVNNSTR